jgi:hypothetical protein
MGSKSDLLESFLNTSSATMLFQIAHSLVYVNSCLNPIIYNFMSGINFEYLKILT